MNPKEKALELVNIFGPTLAVECINEILDATTGDESAGYWLSVREQVAENYIYP